MHSNQGGRGRGAGGEGEGRGRGEAPPPQTLCQARNAAGAETFSHPLFYTFQGRQHFRVDNPHFRVPEMRLREVKPHTQGHTA